MVLNESHPLHELGHVVCESRVLWSIGGGLASSGKGVVHLRIQFLHQLIDLGLQVLDVNHVGVCDVSALDHPRVQVLDVGPRLSHVLLQRGEPLPD